MYTLSPSQVRPLLASIDLTHPFGPRDYALVQFALHTGLRVNELSGLTVDDVALHGQPRDTLTVRPAIAKRRKARYIPLNSKAQAAVRALLGWSAKRGLRTDPQAPLFQTRRHEGLTVRAIQRLLVALRTQAGLTVPATPHSLRHCFATQLARVANLRTVQLALGHQWLSTTQRYLNPTPVEQRHDLERLARPRIER